MIRTVCLVLSLGVASIGVATQPFSVADGRCFELRTYTVAPGKVDTLHRRFQEHALGLFARHHMTVVGFWIPQDKTDTLVYLLAHQSRAAAVESWKAFRADPEWQTAQAETERDGSLTTHVESVFMTPTAYSPLR